MAINVTNETADQLVRRFAKIANVSLSDAIIIAMKEAIDKRLNVETPEQTAARIRAKHNIQLTDQMRESLPKSVYDEMWEGKP